MWLKNTLVLLLVLFVLSSSAKKKKSINWVYHAACPADDDVDDPTHLPLPGDCTSFLKCSYGRAYKISCPTNQHWSTELERCESIDRAKCDQNVTTQKPVVGGNGCQFDYKQHPTDCTKAIQCVDGKENTLLCMEDMYWDQSIKRCAWNTGQCKLQ